MPEFIPTLHTTLFILGFLVVYLALLLRRVVTNRVDLYDFFMLSTLGVVPAFFVVFPGPINWLSRIIGIGFPFFILFGVISLITFMMIYCLIRRSNELQAKIVTLTQELALMRGEGKRGEDRVGESANCTAT